MTIALALAIAIIGGIIFGGIGEQIIHMIEIKGKRRLQRERSMTRDQIRKQVICLVGPTSEQDEYARANQSLTLAGFVVLSVGVFGYKKEDETRKMLEDIHHKKIDMADVIAVIRRPDGSLGNHTASEISYAQSKGKRVAKWESVLMGSFNDW